MTVRTFYYNKTNFYNTAPRGVSTKDRKTVQAFVEDRTRGFDEEDRVLPRRLSRELAGRILDTYC